MLWQRLNGGALESENCDLGQVSFRPGISLSRLVSVLALASTTISVVGTMGCGRRGDGELVEGTVKHIVAAGTGSNDHTPPNIVARRKSSILSFTMSDKERNLDDASWEISVNNHDASSCPPADAKASFSQHRSTKQKRQHFEVHAHLEAEPKSSSGYLYPTVRVKDMAGNSTEVTYEVKQDWIR